jgi:hypothetical protein
MPSKKSTTVVLHKDVHRIKTELAGIYGLKNLLSAGILLFSRLSDSEQKNLIKEVNKLDIKEDQPADLHSAVQSVVKVVTGQGIDIKILPDEENKIADFIVKTLGPKEESIRNLKHKKVL